MFVYTVRWIYLQLWSLGSVLWERTELVNLLYSRFSWIGSVLLRVLEQHTGRFSPTQGTRTAHRYVQSYSGYQNSTLVGSVPLGVLEQHTIKCSPDSRYQNSIQVVSVILWVLHRIAHRQVQSYSGNQNITQVCSLFSPTQCTRTAHKQVQSYPGYQNSTHKDSVLPGPTRTAHRKIQSYSGYQNSTQVGSVLLRVLEQHTERFSPTQGTRTAHRQVQS